MIFQNFVYFVNFSNVKTAFYWGKLRNPNLTDPLSLRGAEILLMWLEFLKHPVPTVK